MEGLTSSSWAIDRRRFWPPEMPLMNTVPTGVSAAIVSPSSASTRSTSSWRCFVDCRSLHACGEG
jgi:hypothetical protein